MGTFLADRRCCPRRCPESVNANRRNSTIAWSARARRTGLRAPRTWWKDGSRPPDARTRVPRAPRQRQPPRSHRARLGTAVHRSFGAPPLSLLSGGGVRDGTAGRREFPSMSFVEGIRDGVRRRDPRGPSEEERGRARAHPARPRRGAWLGLRALLAHAAPAVAAGLQLGLGLHRRLLFRGFRPSHRASAMPDCIARCVPPARGRQSAELALPAGRGSIDRSIGRWID